MSAGLTTVTGTNVCNASDIPLPVGEIVWTPVDNYGNPLSFQIGVSGKGQAGFLPVSAPIFNGVFSINVADTSLTLPVNIGYRVRIYDANQVEILGPGYDFVQPSGTTFDFDTYQPNLAGYITVQYGPQGPPGIPGGTQGGVIPQTIPAGAIDGTNLVYTVAGIVSVPFYFRNGLYQALGVDYTLQVNSSTGITTITRIPQADGSGVMQPATANDPADTHYFLGITPSVGQTGTGTTTPAALLPLLDSSGPVMMLRITNGQLDPVVATNYAGATPPSNYILIDAGAQTAWQIVSTSLQVQALFYSSVPPQGALTSLVFTDTGDGSTRTLTIYNGQIRVT